MGKKTEEGNNYQEIINPFDAVYRGKRFHYDGWRFEDDGKSVIIKVTVDDKTQGELFLPLEEIDRIRQFGWKMQEDAAEKKMRGKRVYCRHLCSINVYSSVYCQIGLHNGPHNINCLTCPYIDGSIEEYDPDAKLDVEEFDVK